MLHPRYGGCRAAFSSSAITLPIRTPSSQGVSCEPKKKGCKIIVADPRHIETARIADLYLPIKNGCNVAFLNAFANCLVNDGLYDKEFVAEHTNGFDEWWETIKNYTPESVQDITGVEPALIHQAAEMYATAKPSAIIGWGMAYASRSRT